MTEDIIEMKTYQDDLTLDEIKANDLEMHEHAIKDAKYYNFSTLQGCVRFMGEATKKVMDSCGVKVLPPLNGKSRAAQKLRSNALERAMKHNGVVVERRKHYKGEDTWKNGLYITKHDTLVAYISEPMTVKDNPDAIIKSPVEGFKPELSFGIITNAKMDVIV